MDFLLLLLLLSVVSVSVAVVVIVVVVNSTQFIRLVAVIFLFYCLFHYSLFLTSYPSSVMYLLFYLFNVIMLRPQNVIFST